MTNAVDWIVATPNLGVEFDLAGNEKTRFSILMNGKYPPFHTAAHRVQRGGRECGSPEVLAYGWLHQRGHGTLHER